MIRRFVFDREADRVVEVGEVRPGRDAGETYATAESDYKDTVNRDPREHAGRSFLLATIEKAERREFSQRKYGTERRWAE